MKRITTTVLFTDLVGSTELSARLGPVAAEELRTTYFSMLRESVAAHEGQEVKSVGDGVMAVYPSVTDALDSAVAIQQALDRHNRSTVEALHVRIGISTGDVTEDGGDFYGEAVVEAARLCDAAQGGRILTTAAVQHQVRRSAHRFEPAGALTLKGLPDPVDAVVLAWEPLLDASPVPVPTRLALAPRGGFVGRALEQAAVRAAFKRAAAGDGSRLVLVGGEPGIGKTTLAADVCRDLSAQGATVLYGRCDEELGLPYQPFVEAVRDFLAVAPDPLLHAIDTRRLAELSRLVPEIRDRVHGDLSPAATDPDAERYLLFGAVTGALADLSAWAPVVVVLDDLHWADGSTVLLLRHLAGALDRAAVLVIGTYRDNDLTVDHPLANLLAAFRREPHVERLALTGLDDNGVVAMMEGLAGHELGGGGVELAHAVRRETEGNPFFAQELLLHLAETGALRQQDGRWVATTALEEIGLPESVREVVGQRVRHLAPAVQQVLTIASVFGRDFDLSLLAAVADLPEDDVLDSLDAAVDARVLDEVAGAPDRYTFTHALFQHTLYDSLSASRRSRLHRRVGEALEDAFGVEPGERIGELAHHWAAATRPSDVHKAALYGHRAGCKALAARAPHEAARWFGQALELLEGETAPDPRMRIDALVGLGDAQRQLGDPGYRDTLLLATSLADELGDVDRLVAATLTNLRGAVSRVGTVDAERVAGLERALAAVGTEPSAHRAELLATLTAELTFCGDIARLWVLAEEAESIARTLGDDTTLLRVLNLTFIPLWVPDALARNRAATAEALAIAERVGDPVARFWAAQNHMNAMVSSGDLDGTADAMAVSVAMADQVGQPYLRWQVTYGQSWFALMRGDAEEAERLANLALEIGSGSGQPDAFTMFGANLVAVRWHQGRVDEIVPLVAQAAGENPGLPGFQAAHAVFLCEAGRADEARPLFEAARAVDFHDAVYDYTWLTTSAVWADTAAWLGDADAAAVLYDRLAPFEAQFVISGATFIGPVGMYLARLAATMGRTEQAQSLFARADSQLRAIRCPFLQARNQVEWARLLVSIGGDADLHVARLLLNEAASTSEIYGCAAVGERARCLLDSLA